MNASDLRKKYLTFFARLGHNIIPSASLIPKVEVELAGTKQVLFTTAGMHPLIQYLLGELHPQGRRLVSVQRCLRTDDIDEVGDAVHNTFFEMLGNWSLGDYWKEETISWSYKFLMNELKLDVERIYVSVFAGDHDSPFDEESHSIWRKLGMPENHIFKYGKKDNWWGPVGEAGPCGPDTEMFYDIVGGELNNQEPATNSERFVEIWNDVFMEYDKQKDNTYKPLKQKNVDTGMGLERMLMVLQGKNNVYETDLFVGAMNRLMEKAAKTDISYLRKIADHTRAIVFLIADGVPILGQDPRGSVLNNLLNISFSYLRQLGINHNYLSYIAEAFINVYGSVYPEVVEKREQILNQISQKEERDIYELSQKAALEEKPFKSIIANPEPERLKEIYVSNATIISGENLSFDELRKGQDSNLTASEVMGTVSAQFKQSLGISVEDSLKVAEKVFNEVKPIEKFNKQELLKGYKDMMKWHSKRSKVGGEKKFAGGLTNNSPKVIAGHTATHLLHQALRDVLGSHVQQTGSNITEERIRFDFSHSQKMTKDEIEKVEKIVNEKIAADLPIKKEILPLEAARKTGAIGLFGEKYGETVSVYSIGDYSKEFCGGPHVRSTGELGKFKILKEGSTGSGLRRIYAQVG